MADKIKELLEKNGQMIIDGSMSTALEQMGANLKLITSGRHALGGYTGVGQKGTYGLFQGGRGLWNYLQLSGNDSRLDGKRLYP